MRGQSPQKASNQMISLKKDPGSDESEIDSRTYSGSNSWRIGNGGVIVMDSMNAQEERVPNRVRELRENKLMTQAQLARKAKVALRTIHSVEKGMNCRMDTKRKILPALGLSFEDKDQVFPPLSRPMPFRTTH